MKCVPILYANDKARMTNAELMGNDKRRVSDRIYSITFRLSVCRPNLAKKLPPPTPDGREGRLFPPEQS